MRISWITDVKCVRKSVGSICIRCGPAGLPSVMMDIGTFAVVLVGKLDMMSVKRELVVSSNGLRDLNNGNENLDVSRMKLYECERVNKSD